MALSLTLYSSIPPSPLNVNASSPTLAEQVQEIATKLQKLDLENPKGLEEATLKRQASDLIGKINSLMQSKQAATHSPLLSVYPPPRLASFKLKSYSKVVVCFATGIFCVVMAIYFLKHFRQASDVS